MRQTSIKRQTAQSFVLFALFNLLPLPVSPARLSLFPLLCFAAWQCVKEPWTPKLFHPGEAATETGAGSGSHANKDEQKQSLCLPGEETKCVFL